MTRKINFPKAWAASGHLTLLAAVAVGFVSMTSPALAGFDWTPPQPAAASPDGESVMMPMHQPSVGIIEAIPFEDTAPEQAAVAPSIPVAAPAPDFEVVQGFGQDMPIVMVLSQIVPADYAYSFDRGVDPSVRISWAGGKPWNVVLEEALKPHNLNVVVVDHTVWIRGADQMDTMPVQSEVPAKALMQEEMDLQMEQDLYGLPADFDVQNSSENMPSEPVSVLMAAQEQNDMSSSLAESEIPSGTEAAFSGRGNRAEMLIKAQMSGRYAQSETSAPESFNDFEPAAFSATTDDGLEPSGVGASGAVVKVLDPYEIRYWKAEKGESLRQLLKSWTDLANVELYWDTDGDYLLPENVGMHGTFTDAVTALLSSYDATGRGPHGTLHPNLPVGPSVLVIDPQDQ